MSKSVMIFGLVLSAILFGVVRKLDKKKEDLKIANGSANGKNTGNGKSSMRVMLTANEKALIDPKKLISRTVLDQVIEKGVLCKSETDKKYCSYLPDIKPPLTGVYSEGDRVVVVLQDEKSIYSKLHEEIMEEIKIPKNVLMDTDTKENFRKHKALRFFAHFILESQLFRNNLYQTLQDKLIIFHITNVSGRASHGPIGFFAVNGKRFYEFIKIVDRDYVDSIDSTSEKSPEYPGNFIHIYR